MNEMNKIHLTDKQWTRVKNTKFKKMKIMSVAHTLEPLLPINDSTVFVLRTKTVIKLPSGWLERTKYKK